MPASPLAPPSTDCLVAAGFDTASWGPGYPGCVNTQEIFGVAGGEYLDYCGYYTNLTSTYRANTISAANKACLDNNRLNTSLAFAADVVSTIVPCLTGYCDGSSTCRAQQPFPCQQTNLVTNGTVLKVDSMDLCIKSICSSNPALQANPDIAGIGLISSYIIQTGIVLLIALSLLFLVIWPMTRNALVVANTQVRYKAKQESRSGHDTLPYHRLYESLYQALIALLLAQGFFALAMSIAALQTLNSPGELGLIDEVALGSASGTIIVPTTFGIYILASFYSESQSWYLFTLSLVAWILGFCITLSPQMFDLNTLNKQDNPFTYSTQFPQVCENITPFHLCGRLVVPDLHPEYAFYYTLCMPIMLGLTIWQLSSLKSFYDLLRRSCPNWFRRIPQWLWLSALHVGALGFFIGPCYVFFKSISDLLANDAVNKNWGFGQIVAILTTVLSIVEFVHTYVESRKSSHVKKSRPRPSVEDAYGSLNESIPLASRSLEV